MPEKDKKGRRSHSKSDSEHESDFVTRLRDCLGEEPIKAFARRCNIPESNLRSYLVRGKKPTLENLSKIASTAGVTMDWLATGRGIKSAAELQRLTRDRCAAAPEVAVSASDIPPELEPFRRQLEAIAKLVTDIPDPEKRAALMTEFSTRAQDAKQMAELKRTVEDLRAAQQKTG